MSFLGFNLFDSGPRYQLTPVKLSVPHVWQEGRPECGIASTMMILKYFGVKNPDRQRIKRMAELPYTQGSIFWGLATAINSYGIDAEVVENKKGMNRKSKQYMVNELNRKGVTLREHSVNVMEMKDNAIKNGVKFKFGEVSLEMILSRVDDSTIPLVMVNEYRLLTGESQIGPHAVVINGFNDDFVFYRDPMFYSGEEDFVRRKRFEKALSDVNGSVIFASRRK